MVDTGQVGTPLRYPFPRAAAAPFDPPPELLALLHLPPQRVTIWDGTSPWLVVKYHDVRALLADNRLSVDIEHAGYPQVGPGHAAREGLPIPFIDLDDPLHGVYRRAASKRFSAGKIATYENVVSSIVQSHIANVGLTPDQSFDLVEEFALPVPSLVICELLGIPSQDRRFFNGVASTFFDLKAGPLAVVQSIRDLHEYLQQLVLRKVDAPGDDLMSDLAAQMASGALDPDEIAAIGHLMVLAGHESTSNMIALSVARLLSSPGLWQEFGGVVDAGGQGRAVEELLRYLDILHVGRRRVALEELEVDGVVIEAGEGVILASDAANRDPAAFVDPNTLMLLREQGSNLTFGHGIHHCLGARLARLEIAAALVQLVQAFPALRLACELDELEFNEQGISYGLRRLPVRC